MARRALQDVQKAIERHTQRLSIEDLAKQGKRHVRVVSGDKVIKIIQAIVDESIRREVGTLAKESRDKIVSKVKEKFDRVTRAQSENEDEIREQRTIILDYQRSVAALEAKQRALLGQIEEMTRHEEEAAKALRRSERRVLKMGTTIENYDGEIARLSGEMKVRDDSVRDLRDRLATKEMELSQAETAMQTLGAQLAAAGQVEQIGSLKEDLNEMKAALAQLGRRPQGSDPAMMQDLVKELANRDVASTKDLEDRFKESMDETLQQISKTLHAATAKPIDNRVEATEVLIDKLFDHDTDMESNYEQLDVSERKTKSSIKGSLAALRAMRGRSGGAKEGKEETPKAEAETAGADTGVKAKKSMETLKKMRKAKKD